MVFAQASTAGKQVHGEFEQKVFQVNRFAGVYEGKWYKETNFVLIKSRYDDAFAHGGFTCTGWAYQQNVVVMNCFDFVI